MSAKTPAGPTQGQPRDSFPKTPFRATITTKREPRQTLTGEVQGLDEHTLEFFVDGEEDVNTFTAHAWSITPEVRVPTKPGAVVRDVRGIIFALDKERYWYLVGNQCPTSVDSIARLISNGARVLSEGYDDAEESK